MVIKIKYWIDNSRKNQIIKAISIINGLQNYYYLMLESSENDVVNETCVDWDVFSKLYSIKMMNMLYLLQKNHLLITGFHMRNVSFQ